MPTVKSKLVRLPKKNEEEAKRILKNLKASLNDIRKQAEDVAIQAVKKSVK